MVMVFDATIEAPYSVEESLPTVHKIVSKRESAGTKRKKYLAAKALEPKKSFQKSKEFRAVSPIV